MMRVSATRFSRLFLNLKCRLEEVAGATFRGRVIHRTATPRSQLEKRPAPSVVPSFHAMFMSACISKQLVRLSSGNLSRVPFLAPTAHLRHTLLGKLQSSFATMADIHTPIPDLTLNDGNKIPLLAYGTGTAWFKSGDEGKIDKGLIDSIKTAIKLEYYHLDGAEVYKTEPELGSAIKESGIDRSKLFVTTKVNQNIKDIQGAIKTSLKKLQLDYVDLYLIHSPFFAKSDEELQKAWADMEAVQAAGLAKSIGVSNYLIPHLEATLKTAKVVPAINQIEYHPYLQHGPLLDFHKKHGIATAAYGPLSAATKAKPGPLDDLYASLAKKYAVSEAEVALRWAIDQDIVAITTSSKEQRLSDYLRAITFKLTPKEIQEIGELGQQKHYRGFWNHIFKQDDTS